MSPAYDIQEVHTLQDDFSRGIVSRVSSLALKKKAPPPFVKSSTNVLWRPSRALSVRPGFRDTSAAVLDEKPTSLGKHYHSSGNKLFVATDDGAGGGKLFRRTQASDTVQALPAGFVATNLGWRFEMANGLLTGCQRGGAQKPIFYSVTNPAETWHSLVLPKPAGAPTFNANTVGGALTQGATYYYRYRWRHTNGSSKTSPVSAGQLVVAASGNYTINVVVAAPGAPRSDYVGCTIERTKANGSASGPFYFVADVAAGVYSDGASDASLFYETDEIIHGEPVAMDGVIFHKGRLLGWYGTLLYVSQPIVGDEGTGICNWIGDLIFPVGKDDGDSIQTVLVQGDRLWIGKRRSIWTLEGDDPENFRIVLRYEGAGVAGPRAACALGGVVFFAAGDTRLFVMRGNAVDPWGATEVGDYLEAMDTTRDAEILAANHLGDLIMFWYVARGKTFAEDVLVYDLRFGNWSHHDNMPATDVLVQKDAFDFNNATLLFADPRVLEPGNSGAVSQNPSFVVWLDKRTVNWQVYVQKVDSNGAPQWTADGVQVSNSTGNSPVDPGWGARVVPDGAGGCIVIFNDMRSGSNRDIYGQRYNASGTALWTAGGVLLQSIAGSEVTIPSIAAVASDKNGGVIYVYRDLTSGLYAQRLNAAGAKQWGTGTHIGDTQAGWVGYGVVGAALLVNSDGSSFAAWYDVRNSPSYRLYAQKLNASGVAQWVSLTSGLVIQNGSIYNSAYVTLSMCHDDAGGFIVGFTHTDGHAHVHRVNGSGAKQWGAAGTVVSQMTVAALVTVIRDTANGCFVAWVENDGGSYTPIIRRVLSTGVPAWSPISLGPTFPLVGGPKTMQAVEDGFGGAVVGWDRGSAYGGFAARLVSSAGVTSWGTEIQVHPYAAPDVDSYNVAPSQAVTDGASGVVVFANDDRLNVGDQAYKEIYAQRLNSDGTLKWAAAGLPVCSATGEQVLKSACFTDTPEGEYAPGAEAGYHVWCALKGTRDKLDVNGGGGDPVSVRVAGHRYDDGLPGYAKDYDHFELFVNRGKGTVVATILADDGTATLSLTAVTNAPKYNTGLKYNSGVKYATVGRVEVGRGLPKGTEGRGAQVLLAGELEDMEIGGWALQGVVLPQKDYS